MGFVLSKRPFDMEMGYGAGDSDQRKVLGKFRFEFRTNPQLSENLTNNNALL